MENTYTLLFRKIEGLDFRFAMNMASGFQSFQDLVIESDLFKTALELFHHENADKLLFERVKCLLDEDVDTEYEHPHDTAVAAYMLILCRLDSHYLKELAHSCMGDYKLFWAHQIARILVYT